MTATSDLKSNIPQMKSASMGDRIKYIRMHVLGISQGEMSNVLNISQAKLCRIEHNVNDAHSDVLCFIIKEYGIDACWLLTGEFKKEELNTMTVLRDALFHISHVAQLSLNRDEEIGEVV